MRLRPRETLRPAEDPVIAGSLRDAARLYDERRSSGAFRYSLAERRAFTVEAFESLFSHMQHAYHLFNERQAVCAVELLQSCLVARDHEPRDYLTAAQQVKLRRGARRVLLDLVENPENPIARARGVPAEELAEALVAAAHDGPTRQSIRCLRAVVEYFGGSAEPEAPVEAAFVAARDALGAECPADLRDATLLPAASSGAGGPPTAAAAAAAAASDDEEASSDYAPSEASDDEGDESDAESYEDDVEDLMDDGTDSEAERELEDDIAASEEDDGADAEDVSDGASTVDEDSRS